MTTAESGARHHTPGRPPVTTDETEVTPYDPLKLCVFATIASLGWLLGPVALAAFAVLGPVGYLRAWRQGLTTSKCLLRDTPLFIAYLAALAGLAVWGLVRLIA